MAVVADADVTTPATSTDNSGAEERQFDEAAKQYRVPKFPDAAPYPVDRVVITKTQHRKRTGS